MNSKTNRKTVTTLCASCDRPTRQHVLFTKKVNEPYRYDPDITELFEYMTIQCAGCKTVSFLRREHVEDPEREGKMMYIEEHYPIEMSDFDGGYNFLHYEDHQELPNVLYNLYEEVKNAFDNDSNILAGVGLRTLVEAICIQQKMPGRTLQDKIKNLHAGGLISSAELPILDKLRLIGNQSTHQIKAIPLDKLNYALDIVNHVLKSIYVLPKINKKLKII